MSNIIVNTYDKDPELNIDLADMHSDAVKFMMGLVEDVSGWYEGLIEEIEAAYALFSGSGLDQYPTCYVTRLALISLAPKIVLVLRPSSSRSFQISHPQICFNDFEDDKL